MRTAKINYAEISENVSAFNEALRYQSVTGLWNVESLRGLAGVSAEISRQSQMIGFGNAFVLYTAACVASLPFIAFVRIKRTSQ